ncbi:MAG: metal ABC transporter solute-binding protein, Zn/Mn family, partial [Alphaproteobacteria bacterium]
ALRGTHDHGHDEHAHEEHDEHAHEQHDEHAHEEHDEHAHEDETHDEHAHEEHAHEEHAHEEHAHEEHDEHDDQARNLDYHLWLDMNNAVKMARWLNSKLGEAYPEYANEFNQNTAKLIAEIQSTQQVAASRLAPIKDKPFLVFHDGFQYFEQENGLNMQGVVFEDGSENLSLKNILELKKIIKANAIECVFDEPQYDPSIISSLKDQFELRSATLDSLAANMNLAQLDEFAGYPNLILNMVDAYLSCLNA